MENKTIEIIEVIEKSKMDPAYKKRVINNLIRFMEETPAESSYESMAKAIYDRFIEPLALYTEYLKRK